MRLLLNGKEREFSALADGAALASLVQTLELKGDRVAIEKNGAIVPRKHWDETVLREGDRLELVHFVGGGS